MNKNDYRFNRVNKIRDYLRKNHIDIAVLFCKENIYYLTGFSTPGSPRGQALIITPNDMLIVSRELEVTNAMIHPLIKEKSNGYKEGTDPIDHLIFNIQKYKCNKIGYEIEYMNGYDLDRFRDISRSICNNLVDISSIVRSMRSEKSELEISYMRRAGEIASIGFNTAIQSASNPEATEGSIAGDILKKTYDNGCEYSAYPPFVALGNNGTLGHHSATRRRINNNELLFLEIGCSYQRYHAAIMRTIYIGEKIPDIIREAGECVIRALNDMRHTAKSNSKPSDIYKAAKKHFIEIEKKGWKLSQRIGYSIGIGFPVDWGEAENIAIKECVKEPEELIPKNATLHLIPWITHKLYGGIGFSDTIIIKDNGGESIINKKMVPEKLSLIKFNTPRLNKALEVLRFFGDRVINPQPLQRLKINNINILVKDESKRLGLNSFKAIGGAYALSKEIIKKYKLNNDLSFDQLIDISTNLKNKCVFTTASDGNHGASIAWSANTLGFKSIIFFPQNVSQSRIKTVEKYNGIVNVTDDNYDNTVIIAKNQSEKNDWILVQDTSWDGYMNIPRNIMDGYSLIAYEVMEDIKKNKYDLTHIILQVGVGSFASSIVEFIREQYSRSIIIICIEPSGAPCLYESIRNGCMIDVNCSGTISAGLDCGKLSYLGWDILKDNINYVIKVNDNIIEDGCRLYNNNNIIGGESGAPIGLGLLSNLNDEQKDQLMINENSSVLVFNTEGITDMDTTKSILKSNSVFTHPEDINILNIAE